MRKNTLWRHEPPEASAEEWAAVFERVVDMMPLDDEGLVVEEDELLHFVLGDAIGRCRLEAENRKPEIIGRRLDTTLRDELTRLERSSH